MVSDVLPAGPILSFRAGEVMKRLSEGPSPVKQESIVERLAVEAIRLGADELEVEYKDGYEWAFAAKAGMGFGIASFRSSNPEAGALRDELHRLAKRKRRIVMVDGLRYELRGRIYDSFGEEAYRVDLRRV